MRRLQQFERELLGLLAENARRSVTELALRLDTTRLRVRKALAHLEASGVIRRYTIETNGVSDAPPAGVKAFLVIKTRSPRCKVLVDKIKTWPEITQFWTFSSRELDFQLEVRMSSYEELEQLREKLAADASVEQIYTMAVLSEWSRATPHQPLPSA